MNFLELMERSVNSLETYFKTVLKMHTRGNTVTINVSEINVVLNLLTNLGIEIKEAKKILDGE